MPNPIIYFDARDLYLIRKAKRTPRRQLFAFPPDMISSMLENTSSNKGLMKLYQTCKYFYAKRPLLIADDAKIWMDDNKNGNKRLEINLSIIPGKRVRGYSPPIWLTKQVQLLGDSNQFQRIPKCFRYSVEKIYLKNNALQFDDFVLLASEKNVQEFRTSHAIYHPDMSKVSIDQVLQHLPNIRHFSYFIDENCPFSAQIKLMDIKFNHKFESFGLDIWDIHGTFDMNLFCEFIMMNSDTNTSISIIFREATKINLRFALEKLDSKWKKEAHPGLKRFFFEITPKPAPGIYDNYHGITKNQGELKKFIQTFMEPILED